MGIEAAAGLLACPLCRSTLGVTDLALSCAQGHSYDLARKGYANLLGGPEPANADMDELELAKSAVTRGGSLDGSPAPPQAARAPISTATMNERTRRFTVDS